MMKTKTILFTIFALAMLTLSVAAAQAYSTDLTNYPLLIQDLRFTGENEISFNLYNPANTDFDMKSLKSFEATFEKTKTSSQFVHYTGSPFTAIGKLDGGYALQYIVPFDREGSTDTSLRCNKPIDVTIYLTDGESIAHWTGIPKCEIEGKRPCGLLKVDDTLAEFRDEAADLQIFWELVDADPATGQVLLMKSVGRQDPQLMWLSAGDCPDVQSGKCMTDVSSILFTTEGVSVTLRDNRHDMFATLRRTFTQQATVTYVQPEPARPVPQDPAPVLTTVQPQATFTQPNTNTVASQAAQAYAQANTNSICVSKCVLDGLCYDEGARQIYLGNFAYCKDGWQVQKSQGFYCKEDFECTTNVCHDNLCVINIQKEEPEQKLSALTRLLTWIDNLL